MKNIEHKLTNFTVYYAIALGIIAVLSLGSHVLLDYMLRDNKGYASLINISGRQRMLSQRIALYANRISDDPDNSKLKLEYEKAINLFEKSHKNLANSEVVQAHDSFGPGKLNKHFFSTASSVEPQVHNYVRLARVLLDPEISQEQMNEIVSKIGDLAESKILSVLDNAVFLFQVESEEKLILLGMVQWVILAVILVTLILEAKLLFSPMAHRIQSLSRNLLNLANIDFLTRLDNRRFFMLRANEEFQRAQRVNKKLVFIVVDVDNLEDVNQLYGYSTGDKLLVSVAASVRASVRVEDVVGRIGGDRIGIILVETELAKSVTLANRIRASVGAVKLRGDSPDITVTVSLGLAEAIPGLHTVGDVIARSELSLKAAKDQGKNRAMVASGDINISPEDFVNTANR